MMFSDGKAAISPSGGPVSKSKLCLCSSKTLISSVLVFIYKVQENIVLNKVKYYHQDSQNSK